MKCSLVGLIVMLPLVALTYWLVDPFVKLVLPKYVESIPIARYLCWLSLIPLIDLPNQLLIVGKYTRPFGISAMIGFVLFLLLLILFVVWGEMITLQKIVIASVVCKMGSVIIADGFTWRIAQKESHTNNATMGVQ